MLGARVLFFCGFNRAVYVAPRCLGGSFRSNQDALKAIDEAVLLFNTKQPHLSLRFKTPDRVHFAALAA